jgi:CBS domain-containing protein
MTTTVVTASGTDTVPELARLMLDRGVQRLVVLDPAGRPVGVVTARDLLQVLAHPDLNPDGAV